MIYFFFNFIHYKISISFCQRFYNLHCVADKRQAIAVIGTGVEPSSFPLIPVQHPRGKLVGVVDEQVSDVGSQMRTDSFPPFPLPDGRLPVSPLELDKHNAVVADENTVGHVPHLLIGTRGGGGVNPHPPRSP